MQLRRILFPLLPALALWCAPIAHADPLSAMQADAQALNAMAQTWPQLQSAAQSYGQLAPYASAMWAGPGPVVTTPWGYREQCHNTRWDTTTQYLVTGGLNIGGDAEAEAYAIQAVATDFQEQLSQYLVTLAQSGNPQEEALANEILAQKGPLLQSLGTLTALLNTTANQLSDAMGPSTDLQPLPISHWQAGIGDAPNLAQVRYLPGPNDGAPIGWYAGMAPSSIWIRLEDICPTGTASLPILPLKAQVEQAVQQALVDEPSLGQVVQPLESGSTWTAPALFSGFGGVGPNPVRERLVAALAADETGIAGYMAPISGPLSQYNGEVQRILKEVASGDD